MTKITYMPWQEVILHTIIELDSKDFFQNVIATQYNPNTPNLFPIVTWKDGIAFTLAYFPETEDTVREKMQGKIHGMVMFTKTDYKESYSVSNTVRVLLNKQISDPSFIDIIEFLKTFKPDPRLVAKIQLA